MVFQKCNILFLLIALGVLQKEIVFAENNTTSLGKSLNSPTFVKSSKTALMPIKSSTNISNPEKTLSTDTSKIGTDENNSTGLIPEINEVIFIEYIETTTQSIEIDDLDEFYYVISDNKTKVPCTLTKMGITLTVPYKTENDTIATSTLKVPLNANVTGNCEENISVLTLVWQESELISETISDEENSLTMGMAKDGDIFYVQYLDVSISLDNINFPNAKDSVITGNSSVDLRLFPATLHTGMHVCNETQKVQADPITVQLDNVSFIAFNNKSDVSARKAEHCTIKNKKKHIKTKAIIGGVIGGTLLVGLVLFVIHRSTRNMNSWNLRRK